ncbi:hypothetical protein [Nitrosomonas sp. Is79A3]
MAAIEEKLKVANEKLASSERLQTLASEEIKVLDQKIQSPNKIMK